MPTTFAGLVLLIVLLLPGLAYVVTRERQGSERKLSPFRETGAVVFASVASELVMLMAFALVRILWPQGTPDVGRLIREGEAYAKAHYASLALWSLILLILASGLAVLAANGPAIASRIRWPRWLAGPAARWGQRQQHPSTVSAWGRLFREWNPGKAIHVACLLEDGSLVEGLPISYNISADDSPDRDLILTRPKYRPPGGRGDAQPYDAGAVCISARRIVTMFVSYFPAEAAEVAGTTAVGQPAPVAAPAPRSPAPSPRSPDPAPQTGASA